jgi:hypothetical protein
MTNRKNIVIACFVLLGAYLVMYAYARMTHHIVHLQNRSEGKQTVAATPDEWSDLLIDMSKGKPVVGAYARGQKKTPVVLNVFFWPLRSLEEVWWNWGNKRGTGFPTR